MKKTIILVLLISLICGLVGCNKNDLAVYNEAIKKTDAIKKGQMSCDINIENEIDEEEMTVEELKNVSYIKKIRAVISTKYDWEKDKLISNNYLNLGGVGYDSILYINGENIFFKIPFLGKYIDLSNIQNKNQKSPITKETMKRISEKWLEILGEKDVASGEKILLTTDDGEVKAKQFTINLKDEQLREFINYALDTLEEDERFSNFVKDVIISSSDDVKEFNAKSFLDSLKEVVNNSENLSFKYDAFIDIDNYKIEENIGISLEPQQGEIKKQQINIVTKHWNIEKEQKFEFPSLTKENTIKGDDMNSEMPIIIDELQNSEE